MNARLVRPAQFRSGTLCAIALLFLSGAACFRTLDVSKLHCLDNNGCPSGNYCANGRCVAGQAFVDGSNADLTRPSGLDGQAGLDGMQSTDGTGGSAVDGAHGGADGTVLDSALGGAGGAVDVPLAGAGGSVADAALGGASGGSADVSGTGGTSASTGGTGPLDAPGGTGGTTSTGGTNPTGGMTSTGGTTSTRDGGTDVAAGGSSNGTACSADGDCASTHCVDGHCCTVASCGTCQSCTGPGGTCVAVTNAEDPDSCTGASTCNASGACKKKTGQTCTAGTECVSGNCADTVCCNSACNGSCENCNGSSPGSCGYVTGAPQTGHPACAGSGLCQGTCNGTKASCTFPGAETTCRQPSCSGTTATNPAVCDGLGNCPTLSTTPCSPFICGTTSCLTSCSGSSQCVTGAACVSGACQPCGSNSVCGNACVNTSSDPANCGQCAHTCPSGTPRCVNGGCVQCTSFSDCPTGYQNCISNTCVCRQKSPTNSVPDAGLDSAANFSSTWSPSNSTVVWSSFDADGCPDSGSLEILPGSTAGTAFTLGCTRVGSSSNATFGFKFWQDAPTSANCYVAFFSDVSCSTQTSGFPPPTIYTSDVTRSWTSAYLLLDSGTNSITASCFFPQPQGTTVYFDQFYLNYGGSTY